MDLGKDGQSHSQASGREQTEGKRLLDQCPRLATKEVLDSALPIYERRERRWFVLRETLICIKERETLVCVKKPAMRHKRGK